MIKKCIMFVLLEAAIGMILLLVSAQLIIADNNGSTDAKEPPIIKGKDGAEMVPIPRGEFMMGDSHNEGNPAEKPVHTVYLDAFYMDRYEVTNALYKAFIDATGHEEPRFWKSSRYNASDNSSRYNAPDNPVVGVSWHDAKAYAEWAGKRLPTEAEWEKAARGGLVGRNYVWGDEPIPPADTMSLISFSKPVGSFKANGYGLYDMVGNVWEWCADWYDENYYKESPKSNPRGPETGIHRVLRGNCWRFTDQNVYEGILFVFFLRVSSRYDALPESKTSNIGFRCVMDIPKK